MYIHICIYIWVRGTFENSKHSISIWLYVYIYIYIYIDIYVYIYIYIYICIYIYMYVRDTLESAHRAILHIHI